MLFSTSHLLRRSLRQLGQALSGWAPPTSASHSARNVCRVLADPWRVCRNRDVKGRRAMITYRAMSGYRCLRMISPICSPPNLCHIYREFCKGCAGTSDSQPRRYVFFLRSIQNREGYAGERHKFYGWRCDVVTARFTLQTVATLLPYNAGHIRKNISIERSKSRRHIIETYHILDVDVLLPRQLSRSVCVRDRGCQTV